MKNKISSKFKLYRIFSILAILLGALLAIYMVKVEDEPGALPLLLIASGCALLVLCQIRIKKYSKR